MNLQWTNSIKVEQKIGQPIKHIYDLFSSRQKVENFSENQTICKQKKTKVISKRKNADQVMTKEHKFKGRKKKRTCFLKKQETFNTLNMNISGPIITKRRRRRRRRRSKNSPAYCHCFISSQVPINNI